MARVACEIHSSEAQSIDMSSATNAPLPRSMQLRSLHTWMDMIGNATKRVESRALISADSKRCEVAAPAKGTRQKRRLPRQPRAVSASAASTAASLTAKRRMRLF